MILENSDVKSFWRCLIRLTMNSVFPPKFQNISVHSYELYYTFDNYLTNLTALHFINLFTLSSPPTFRPFTHYACFCVFASFFGGFRVFASFIQSTKRKILHCVWQKFALGGGDIAKKLAYLGCKIMP